MLGECKEGLIRRNDVISCVWDSKPVFMVRCNADMLKPRFPKG